MLSGPEYRIGRELGVVIALPSHSPTRAARPPDRRAAFADMTWSGLRDPTHRKRRYAAVTAIAATAAAACSAVDTVVTPAYGAVMKGVPGVVLASALLCGCYA